MNYAIDGRRWNGTWFIAPTYLRIDRKSTITPEHPKSRNGRPKFDTNQQER